MDSTTVEAADSSSIEDEPVFFDENNFTVGYDNISFSLEMDLGPRIIWDFLFSSMILVAVVGNLIVLWIVTAHRYMRTIPNAFIANMSLSDLLMAVLNCTFNYVTMRDRKWDFGQTYCTINNFMAIVSVATSVLNLTAMSLDRYKAIVWPLRMRTSKCVVTATILAIWMGSTLFAMPALLFSKTEEMGPGQVICYIKWPDDNYGTSFYDYIYNVSILLVTYVAPIIAIGVITIHMTIVLWCRQPLCIITPQLERAKRKKQKIVKMLVVLIVIFAICWLPYHIYFLYSYHFPEIRALSYIQHVFLAFYWCAMAHSMVNPIVYYFMNPKFRHYYRHILCLKWLKPNAHNAPTGLILASTFGLQVAAHLAYSGNAEENEDGCRSNLPQESCRRGSNSTQASSLASSSRSNRRRFSLRPEVTIFEVQEGNAQDQEDLLNKDQVAAPPLKVDFPRRFSDALSLAIRHSENHYNLKRKRPSMVVAINDDLLAEDLLDISKENEIEIAATAASSTNLHNSSSSSTSTRPRTSPYSTSLFPRVTQV